jgi:lipoate synthase
VSRREDTHEDGPQLHVDIQLVRREAQEQIHVEITTNDFDESQQRSLLGWLFEFRGGN